MKHTLRALIVLIAFALSGAPFGMAQMMGGHDVGAQHQHHMPQKSAPHATFMVCGASVCVNALPEVMPERLPMVETLALGEFSVPDGLDSIPLLPPPRS